MTDFAKLILEWLQYGSVHLAVYGDMNSGKSCWVLSLFEALFKRIQFLITFDPSGLDGLLDELIKAIFIDESGEGFDSRQFKISIAKIFQWSRVFNKLVVLATTHEENNDIIIRERSTFINVKMLPPKKGQSTMKAIVQGVGLVKANIVSEELLIEFQKLEYEKKVVLVQNQLSKIPSSKYFNRKK